MLRRRFSPFYLVESGTRASQRKPRHPTNDDEIGMFIVIARTVFCPRGCSTTATLPSTYFTFFVSTNFFFDPRCIHLFKVASPLSLSLYSSLPRLISERSFLFVTNIRQVFKLDTFYIYIYFKWIIVKSFSPLSKTFCNI